MFYRNRIKEAIQNSGFAIGTFVQIGSAENAEIAAAIGFDFIILDMEHGSFGIDVLVNMIRGVQLAGSTPIVRLPDDSETGILKALDAGAGGILISGVSNAEQAKRITKAARYAPMGRRGACPRVRATGHGLWPWEKHADWSNQNVIVWFLIETLEGFDNFEEIVATPGIDAVAFGAFDLSQNLGYQGKTNHPEVKKIIEKAINIAKKNNVDINMHLFESSANEIRESARIWASQGARILTCMTDRRVLTIGFKEAYSGLASLRDK